MTPMMPLTTPIEELVEKKHSEYLKKAKLFSISYYAIRLMAGLSAALLPFTIRTSVLWSTIFSVVTVMVTVLDLVFAPKDRWVLYSKATDLLAVAKIKARGDYEEHKEALEIITQTETANLQQLINLDDLVSKIDKASSSRRSE